MPFQHLNSFWQNDLECSLREREERIAHFKKEQQQTPFALPKNRTVRQRPKISKKMFTEITTSIATHLENDNEVEAAIETSIERITETETSARPKIDLINRDEFIHRIQTRGFQLPDCYYPAPQDAASVWDNLLGNIVTNKGVLHENRFLTKYDSLTLLTDRVCEQVLRHYHQFKFGLDLQHPFAGSRFRDTQKAELEALDRANDMSRNQAYLPRLFYPKIPVLDLDDAVDKNAHEVHPLSVRLYQPLEAEPLSQALLHRWLDKKDKTFFEQTFEKEYYAQVTTHCDKNALNEWKKKFLKAFHRQSTPHLLFQFIDHTPLAETLKHYHKQLNLTARDLDCLLSIYDKYAEAGLEKLFDCWQTIDSSLLAMMSKHLFPKMHTFLPFLTGDYQTAFNTIKMLTPEQRIWWDNLYAQHCDSVGEDNLPALVNAFQHFVSSIKDLQLEFYSQLHFSDIKSLPTTLSRMLTILYQCRKDDRQRQWAAITQLNFNSNCAIRAVTDIKEMVATVVLPEMKPLPSHFYPRHDKTTFDNDKMPLSGFHALTENSSSQTMHPRLHCLLSHLDFFRGYQQFSRNLYRYIASHPHRFSVEFYEKAFKRIDEKFADHFLPYNRVIHALVVVATTGLETQALLNDEETSLQEIEHICDIIQSLSLMLGLSFLNWVMKFSTITNALLNDSYIPPLPYLTTYLRYKVSSYSIGIFDIVQHIAEEAETKNRALLTKQHDVMQQVKTLTSRYKFAIHAGLKFADLNSDTEVVDYVNVAMKLTHQARVTYLKPSAKIDYSLGAYPFRYIRQNNALIYVIPEDLSKKPFKFNLSPQEIKDFDDIFIKRIKPRRKSCLIDIEDIDYIRSLDPNHCPEFFGFSILDKENDAWFKFVLLHLLSLFKINSTNISSIDQIIKSFEQAVAPLPQAKQLIAYFIYSLELLTYIDKDRLSPSEPALNHLNLIALLDFLVNLLPTASPEDFLKKSMERIFTDFEKYFPTNFLARFFSTELSNDITDLIDKNFSTIEEKKLVCDILSSFMEERDKLNHQLAANYLIKIYVSLPHNSGEKFLQVCHKLSKRTITSLSKFCELLQEIGNSNNIRDLELLMTMQPTRTKNSPSFIDSILLHYRHVMPYLRKHAICDATILAFTTNLIFLSSDSIFFNKVMDVIRQLIVDHPIEKQRLLELVHYYYEKIKTSNNAKDKLLNFVEILKIEFTQLDSDMIKTFCFHYSKKPQQLKKLFHLTKDFSPAEKNIVLNQIRVLLNNNCDMSHLQEVIELYKTYPTFLTAAKQCYEEPPYPSLSQLIAWHQQLRHLSTEEYTTQINKLYKDYSMSPGKRDPENAFDLVRATQQAKLFEGVTFSKEQLEQLNSDIENVKLLPSNQLREELSYAKKLSPTRFIAVLVELLYRSKNIELNTTQYLVMLAFIISGTHTTSEIATGEGKSRIMMLACACQYFISNTVDFVTSNIQLAQRDYLEYSAFFKMLKAPTRLITTQMNSSQYVIKGINFFDEVSFNLFRGKARSSGEGRAIIDPNPHERALLLDETDRFFYDTSNIRFNFSALLQTNKKNKDWIYTFLIQFFNQYGIRRTEIHNLYWNDMDACNDEFYKFVTAHPDCTQEKLDFLKHLPQEELESLQDAAVTALSLELGKDYRIKTNVITDTIEGPQLTSEAYFTQSDRLDVNTKFAFGVQQCLHAYLNEEFKNPNATIVKQFMALEKNPAFKLADMQPFYIHPEKHIIYSSTNKASIDEYDHGFVWSVSGSTGSDIEREEAAVLYSDQANQQPMKFINVPRHKPLRRLDKPIRLTANFEQRVAALAEETLEARKTNRSVLIVCENDAEAARIYERLQSLLKNVAKEDWQYLDSTHTEEKEASIIQRGGLANKITIANKRLVRGIHIPVIPEIEEKGGLLTLGAFFPSSKRELLQLFGRSGRYGELGEARLVVDKEQLSRKKKLSNHFFFAAEHYIEKLQLETDRDAQVERLIRNTLSDFRIKVTRSFFAYYDAKFDPKKQEMLLHWANFTRQLDELWNTTWPHILKVANQTNPDVDAVQQQLQLFEEKAQEKWQQLRDNLQERDTTLLPEKLHHLSMSEQTQQLLTSPQKMITHLPDRTSVYKEYDRALDGRAAIYDELFADWKAVWRGQRKLFANTRAAFAGHGLLFADTRAWWAGKRPLFANLRGWLHRKWPDLFNARFGTEDSPTSASTKTPSNSLSIAPTPTIRMRKA